SAHPVGRQTRVKGELVSRRMLRLDIPVFPDRRMFRVHDATVDPDAPGGPLAPLGALMSVNREQMWVGSLQEHIAGRLFLEGWGRNPDGSGAPQRPGAPGSYGATVVTVEGPGRSLSAGCCGAATDGCRDTGVARPPLPRSGMARRGSSAYAIKDTTVTATSTTHAARIRTRGERSRCAEPG